MSSSWQACQELTASVQPGGSRQAVVTTQVDPGTFEALAASIDAAYPGMEPNSAAVEKGGLRPDGSKIVPYAVKRRFPTKASITFYDSGKVVWAGVDPL